MDRLDPIEPTEKDAPLRYDIRLLGRILGDTVRAQEGEEVFELVEHIRRTGVQFHRNADETARQELQSIMSGLPTDRALSIIRAFGYFSHLANIAEDQHHIRRTRAYAKAEAPPRPGTMAYALGRARQARFTREQLQGFFDHALCSPVLTAHPTEIRRKSSIDREMEIARLLDERDRIEFTPEELAANRRALRRNVLTLWQTSLVRGTRLRVIDEVANGLSYYDYTFLRALPLFYADLERLLGATDPAWQEVKVPSFLRMGSWIGGDRDGNPFVTADVTRQTLAMQSERAMRFYLEELHQLGGELSLDGRIVGVSDGLQGAGRRARPTAPSSARTNPIGAPSSACMRGSPPPPGRSTSWKRRIRRSGLRRPTTRWTTSRPISTPSSTRCRRTARRPWRAAACALCAARSTSSASISHRSTCGRIRTCTSASWPSSSRPRASATIVRSTSPAASRCWYASSATCGRSPRRISATARRRRTSSPC